MGQYSIVVLVSCFCGMHHQECVVKSDTVLKISPIPTLSP